MIISPGRRFIFVHIPKTGGTSLAYALDDRAMKDDILIGDTPKAQRRKRRLQGAETAGRLWKHSTLADVEGLVSRQDMADFFVFTLVRNPWDRLVSYYHWLQGQGFNHPAVHLAKTVGFSAFLNAPTTQASVAAHHYASYLTDTAGRNHADLFVRIEQADSDLQPFWDHVGFRMALPVLNQSARHKDYRRYYSDADAALVARLCAGDIAGSGYRFDPPD